MDLDGVVEALDAYVERAMQAWGPVGMVVAITDRERTLLTRTYGYANLEAQVPVAEETLFQIGSIGKSFTAFALMVEREAGRTHLLQTPITDFVPWFDPPTKMRAITIHDLLTHSGGLTIGTESHQESLAEAWSLRRQEPGFAPGTNTFYSNLGYKLLGFVLERLTGQRYSEAVAQRVFSPVGMGASYGAITDELRPYTAVGYRRLYRDRPSRASDPQVPVDWVLSESGDGSITSNAPDMAAYLRMIMNGGEVPGGGHIVDLESYDLMTRRYFEDWEEPGLHYGFGLFGADVDGHRTVGHSGGMVGHRSNIDADLDAGLGVVVLANSSRPAELAGYVLRLARAAREREMLPEPPTDPDAEPIAGGLDAYAGTFTCGGRSMSLSVQGSDLVAEVDSASDRLQWRGGGGFLGAHPSLAGFLLRGVREGERVVAFTHGGDLWQSGTAFGSLSTPATWETYVGHYRSYNPWLSQFHVVARGGSLVLIEHDDSRDPGESEHQLQPLPDGKSFRVGAAEWMPGRITFEPIVGGAALHATLDGGVYDRVQGD